MPGIATKISLNDPMFGFSNFSAMVAMIKRHVKNTMGITAKSTIAVVASSFGLLLMIFLFNYMLF